MTRLIKASLIALLVGSIASSMAAELVTVSGSTTVMPLAELCKEDFNMAQSNFAVSVTGGGTGTGITNIISGLSDIAMASREVTPQEKKDNPGKEFKEYLIGYDGVCIAVSKAVYDDGVKDLTRAEVKKIYGGEIKNWKDLGRGPDKEIVVLERMPGSGTRDTFNEVIMGDKKAETVGEGRLDSSDVKSALVAKGTYGIGYLGYSFTKEGDIKAIPLDGVEPTLENIRKGSYALSRKLYLCTYGDPKPGAKAFIEFVLSPQGQKIAEVNGFIPLKETAAVAATSQTKNATPPAAQRQPGFEGIIATTGLLAIAYLLGRKG
jgi:phosphate transport system substrate-binding protein